MNASDILKYGHLTVLKTIDGLPEEDWRIGGVVGWWSVKDIIAHLASFELVLTDVLNQFLEGVPTPVLDQFKTLKGDDFNAAQVGQRQERTLQEVREEYIQAHTHNAALILRLPEETRIRPGTIPWYGGEYAIDDFIVYNHYGHKREHSAQIALFRDRIKR